MKKLAVPKFRSEKAEARWWDAHMDLVQAQFLEAIKKGTVRSGGPARVIEERNRASKNITMRMRVSDIEKARLLAAEKGIGYQTYIKLLLREALDRAARTAMVRPSRH